MIPYLIFVNYIDNLSMRGDKIELLVNKTENLNSAVSILFQVQKNYVMFIYLFFIVTILSSNK